MTTNVWPGAAVTVKADGSSETFKGTAGFVSPRAEFAPKREARLDGFAALDRLRDRGITDATFLLKRIAAMPGDGYTREAFGDGIDLGFTLRPGPGTPSRTLAFFAGAPCVAASPGPLRTRPDLRAELARPPRSV